MKNIRADKTYVMNGFFFEPWLLNELNDQEYPTFVSGLNLRESAAAYHLCIEVANVKEGDYSIHIELPYLYIRLQQREYPDQLFGELFPPPILRVFARHLFIPEDVNTDGIVYHLDENNFSIYLPKYSRR
jgi:hypothetical protein